MYQQEDEQTAGETVYVCKDVNKQCAFARDTEAKLQSLAHLSHAQMCAQQFCRTGQRHREKEQNNSSCDHVLEKARALVIHLFYPHRCGALGRTAVDDYLNNKTLTSRSREGLPSRVQDFS